jgi:hypothetical protein
MVTRFQRYARVCGLALAVAACGPDNAVQHPSPPRDSESPNMPTPALEIVVDATFVADVGYGLVWKATVRQVGAGALADQTLHLTTFGDPDGAQYHGHFRETTEQRGVKLTLHRVAKRPAALAGFVAADGTIWEIVDAP